MICNSGDIVTVPFPFVDNANVKPRPALVVSSKIFNEKHDHTVLVMITTGASVKWDTDIEIIDIILAGLPIKSFVRFKFFTLDNRLIKKAIGKLDDKSFDIVKECLTKNLFT
jgi:mRNA-degrading endonuclease toxin of MazEF toxin-antitoxin module